MPHPQTPPRPSLVDEAESLLSELDGTSKPAASPASPAPAEVRRDRRMPYRRSLRLERRNSAGSKVASWIYARDLSAGGLGCLALELLEPGTAVTVHLPAEGDGGGIGSGDGGGGGGGGGGVDEIEARVVHTRHLKQEWHVLGLKFDTPIEPERYVDNA